MTSAETKVRLNRIRYRELNSRQKENFNFQKVSAVLADYGFVTMRLSDDWQGADFIALHINGKNVLRVQLKSRCTFQKAYVGKDLHIAFPDGEAWYIYPHDVILDQALKATTIGATRSWCKDAGGYSFPSVPKEIRRLLAPYRINGDTKAMPGAPN